MNINFKYKVGQDIRYRKLVILSLFDDAVKICDGTIKELNIRKSCDNKDEYEPVYVLTNGRKVSEKDIIIEGDAEEEVKTANVNRIRWKDVFNCYKMPDKEFDECKAIAKSVGYDYMSFNGLIHYTFLARTPDEYICKEEDLLVD